jgi:cyclopropane-fatty-acyl-phospholipid synthase
MSAIAGAALNQQLALSGGWLERAARRQVLSRMQALAHGRLVVEEDGQKQVFGQADETSGLEARLTVHRPAFWPAVALRGSVGAGEAYARGHWTARDLPAVMRLMTRNRELLERLEGGLARLSAPWLRLFGFLHRNTRAGSRLNIAAHYDLGNDFFRLFLDESMTYSCGLFERDDATLAQASEAKLDRLCRKLDLGPGDHLLEIGTGWGSLAIHAASRYGCRVTTTTISRRQAELARERVAEAGFADRVEVLLQDYRDLTGHYDKLVSVEMIEAVGHAYYPSFFRRAAELLRPQGLMLLQAITMADHGYDRARRGVDFIKRYIFPGSCIPSVTALSRAMSEASDLRLVHLEDLTPHYARTLRCWRENLLESADQVRALGHGEEFLRTWEYYLALCEGGFEERYLGDVQMLLARPLHRGAPVLPRLEPAARSALTRL